MQCTLCGASGTQFTKARHVRLGIVYLCPICTKNEQEHLRPAREGGTCACGGGLS